MHWTLIQLKYLPMKVWWSDLSACVSSFCWKLTWSLVLLAITRLSLRKHAIENCSVPIRGYFTKRNLFITLIDGCSRHTGDVYKTCYCFKRQAALCRLHSAGTCEVVTLRVLGDVPDPAASLLLCWRDSTGRSSGNSPWSRFFGYETQKRLVTHSHSISLASENVNTHYHWPALRVYQQCELILNNKFLYKGQKCEPFPYCLVLCIKSMVIFGSIRLWPLIL